MVESSSQERAQLQPGERAEVVSGLIARTCRTYEALAEGQKSGKMERSKGRRFFGSKVGKQDQGGGAGDGFKERRGEEGERREVNATVETAEWRR